MKNIFKKVTLLGLVAFFVSCSDTDRPIDALNEGTTRGTVLKTVADLTKTEFRVGLEDVVEITVDVIDTDKGASAEKIDVYLSFVDNNPDDGDNTMEEELIQTIPASAFDTSGEFPRASFSLNAQDIQNIFGLTPDDYTGGDRFVIRLALTLTDGRVFTSTNVNSTVAGGPFYRSPFQYVINVTCEVPEDYFVGTYLMEKISLEEDPFFPALGQAFTTAGQVVDIEADGPERIFTFSYYPEPQGFQFGQVMTLTLVCGDIEVFGTAVGGTLGCGGGTIQQATPPVPSTYELDNDDVIIVDLLDFEPDAGCGTGNYPVTLRFTKQ